MQNLEKKDNKSKKSKKSNAKQQNKKKLADFEAKSMKNLLQNVDLCQTKQNDENRKKNNENFNQNRVVPLKSVKGGVYNKFNVLINGWTICESEKEMTEFVSFEPFQVNSIKYKTEVCKYWQNNKCCKYNTDRYNYNR